LKSGQELPGIHQATGHYDEPCANFVTPVGRDMPAACSVVPPKAGDQRVEQIVLVKAELFGDLP